jgi:membrane protease YdiL (CAAX protease family)
VWVAIFVTSVLFGLAHFSTADNIGADPVEWLVFAVIQKGLVVGGLLGWLAWRWGLEAAFLAHYLTGLMVMFIAARGA